MLIGRTRELTVVSESLAGERPFLVVTGEAGVGKTSLLRTAIAASARPVFEGGAFATLSWIPFYPLSRAFSAEISDGDPAYVAADIEQRMTPESVLFLDDLHWADGETLATLELLAGRIALATAVRIGDAASAAVLRRLDEVGVKQVELRGLDEADALSLVKRTNPDVRDAMARRAVEAAAGNPLLLRELASSGDLSPSLKLSLAARCRALSAEAREAIGLLALAQRPLPVSVLAPGHDELVEADIAVRKGRSIELRHALLGDAAIEQLAADETRALHAKLAARLRDPGESGRHHLAAGELEAALAKALKAAAKATSLGERAEHLRIAALSAEGEEADRLRLEAAEALLQASRIEEADELAQSVTGGPPALQVAAHALRARTRLQSGDLERAQRELDAAIEAGKSADLDTDVQLGLIGADILIHSEARLSEALTITKPLAARAAGTPLEPAVLTRLGLLLAELEAPRDEWMQLYRDAISAARHQGQTGLELETANGFVLNLTGEDWPEFRRITEEMVTRASELRLLDWERRFRAHRVTAGLHEGDYERASEEAELLLVEPLNLVPLNTLLIEYTQILVDLGEFDRAESTIARLNAQFAARPRHRGIPSWLEAELHFWGGRAAPAFEAAERALVELGPDPAANGPLVAVTRAWAAIDLDRTPEPAPDTPRYDWLTRAGTAETAALIKLGDQPETAAGELVKAAELWAPHFLRHELRCRWGAGEAFRRAGRLADAVRILEDVEQRAERHGFVPLLHRIRRSLRLAGVRRSAPRQPNGPVTAREREILELVAKGLTNPEIARRLGIGTATVSDAIASASRKLGASNRAQAAAALAAASE